MAERRGRIFDCAPHVAAIEQTTEESTLTRIKRGVIKKRRHKKMLKATKGHQGVRHLHFRRAHESLIHALRYSYAHRKERKGDMRKLWNLRINAAARANGTTYSQLIHGLKLAGVDVNRKVLSEMAIRDPEVFTQIAEQAKAQLAAA
jgi:large subunit ribosomal protein L20|tara:strand:- start:3310 stop:3750 length:441 start_codon:yes stop_codon:yes gene_type:complete